VALALLLGAVLVALVFVQVDVRGGFALRPRFPIGAFGGRLAVHARWIAPFCLAAAALPALRALVWRAVVPAPPPALRDVYHATAMGALVHNAVPGKLGPVAASWILARFSRRAFTPLLASQLLAKLVEMGAVVLLGGAAAVALRPGGGVARVVAAGAALFLALASGAAAAAIAAPGASARLARRLPRAAATLAALGRGLTGVGDPRRLLAAAALALPIAALLSLAYALPLAAAGGRPSLPGAAVLVAVLTFGQLTPGLPIGTGVYWSLASWVARELGAPPADAAAVAVLTHAAMVGTNLAVGAVSAAARRGVLPELLRRRRDVERLVDEAAPLADASPRAPT
jgi:hypothetical protein